MSSQDHDREDYLEYPFRDPSLPLETRVNDLLSRLTLEEKIGLIPTRQAAVERLGIKEYWVGGEAAHGLVARDGAATVFPQPIGLACTWDCDLLHEIGSVIGDEARAYYRKRQGRGGLTLWAPTVDMERDPRWGRTEEAYGEDPCLTGRLTTALVRGMQGDHPFYLKMAATLKHFFANNNEVDRLRDSVTVDPRNMREYYWNAFKPAIVDGKACCIMTAYNSINGRPCILNPDVQKVVKEEWGLQGFVVGDGGDFSQTVTHHHYYDNHAISIAETLKSGVDCIPDNPELIQNALREALAQGLLTENDIDRALRDIFRIRFRLGQFDPEHLNPYSGIPESVICAPEHSALARKAARESIVLLKNENRMLPLDKNKLKKIAVIGPLGDVVYRDWYTGTAPYQVTILQGLKNALPDKEIVFKDGRDQITLASLASGKYVAPGGENHALVANKDRAGSEEVFDLCDWGWGRYTLQSRKNGKFVTTGDALYASADEVWGWFVRELYDLVPDGEGHFILKTWDGKTVTAGAGGSEPLKAMEGDAVTGAEKFRLETIARGLEEAVEAARQADVAIVCLGNHPLINGKEEIDRPDICLPKSQEKLLQAVYEANPNTVLVLVSSYPVALNWAQDHIPAILFSSHGGQELGNAVADVLLGDYNPAGRLNMTWYRSVKQLPDMRDYDIIRGKRTYMYFDGDPLYPFGYGLSYTGFSYGNLKLSSRSLSEDGQVTVSFDVTNTGKIAGDEVVQLYVRAQKSRVPRPKKELKGFTRIHLKPGETKNVSFTLSGEQLAFWDVTREKFCVESGTYEIMIGASSADIRLTGILEVSGEVIPPRNLKKPTRAENYDDCRGIFLDESYEDRVCVRNLEEKAWIAFWDAEFKGVSRFEARTAGGKGGGTIEIRLGSPTGPLAGVCRFPDTGGPQSWTTQTCSIQGPEGRLDVYLVLSGQVGLGRFRFA